MVQKCFWHPSFVIYFFRNLTHKTKTGTANRWETTKSKPPGLIIMIGQSEIGSTGQTLICRCAGLLWHLPSSAKLDAKVLGQNHWAKPAHFDILTFLHPILTIRSTYWASLGMLVRRCLWLWLKQIIINYHFSKSWQLKDCQILFLTSKWFFTN